MLGYLLLVSLAGTVFTTQIFFDSPTPTEPYQVTKFFTLQYITTTVALSPHTVTETVNPTCTITASSIPVCGEASVGIIFTSGGLIPPPDRLDITTTENVPITTATAALPTGEAQRDDEEEITSCGPVDEDENNMKEEDSVTTTLPFARLDLTENEINDYDYNEVETTTFITEFKEEAISNDIPDDKISTISNTDKTIKNGEEIISVTNIDHTKDEEVLSIINAINSSPQTSVVPIEATQSLVQTSDNIRIASESDTSHMPSSLSQQQSLPLSTSFEMAAVVLPSCDCASGRQPRIGSGADIITFMTTKTVDVATVTETGMSTYTIQYAGCLPEDAVVTSSCV